jgi:protein-S-isoprenylcysteine O-methyltransferase Ste14
MDPRLKKRIMLFYFAGVINVVLGIYVVIEGRAFLPPETARWLALFFFAFAAVDFWFPRMLKRKWQDMQSQAATRQTAQGGGKGDEGKK